MTDVASKEPPLLRVEDLVTWLPTARGVVRAVDGVSLALHHGRTLAIVGESGSGKSMLGRSILGLLPARAATPRGRVLFDGQDLRSLPPNELRSLWGRDLSLVFQDPMTSLSPVVRVGQHITEVLSAHTDLNRSKARQRAIELLDDVGIPQPSQHIDDYPHQLSGGMRQRVSIAIAIACNPKLLIADEPTTALDVRVQRQILDLFDSLQAERHMATILITHDLAVVAGRADEVAVMYGGRIVETGSPRAIFTRARHPYTVALLNSIPRLEHPPHTRLATTAGVRAAVNASVGCRFAHRCEFVQPRCVAEDPPLAEGNEPEHAYACFHPIEVS